MAKLGSASPVTGPAIKALSHTYVVDRIFAAHMMRKSAEGVAERVAVESGDITKLPFADAVHC